MRNNIKIDALERTIQKLRQRLHDLPQSDHSSEEGWDLEDEIKELEAELDKEYLK